MLSSASHVEYVPTHPVNVYEVQDDAAGLSPSSPAAHCVC